MLLVSSCVCLCLYACVCACVCVRVLVFACVRAIYVNIEGGRPQGHHHLNGDALVGYVPRLLLIQPNPIQPL